MRLGVFSFGPWASPPSSGACVCLWVWAFGSLAPFVRWVRGPGCRVCFLGEALGRMGLYTGLERLPQEYHTCIHPFLEVTWAFFFTTNGLDFNIYTKSYEDGWALRYMYHGIDFVIEFGKAWGTPENPTWTCTRIPLKISIVVRIPPLPLTSLFAYPSSHHSWLKLCCCRPFPSGSILLKVAAIQWRPFLNFADNIYTALPRRLQPFLLHKKR